MSDRQAVARAALAGTAYEPLWSAARTRLERNGIYLGGSPLRLDGLTPDQRGVVAGLVGLTAAGSAALKVRLEDVDRALATGAAGIGLIAWLEHLGGPLVDKTAARTAAKVAAGDAWSAVDGHDVFLRHPELAAWVAGVRRAGTATKRTGSVVAGARLVADALDVINHLPATNVPLPVLAAQLTGDAHALDRDTPLGSLVNTALAVLDTEEVDEDRGEWPTASAYWWRRRWARAGVICDDLSVSALVLNLPVASGGDVIADSIYEHAMCGEPMRLTLRQLAIAEIEVDPVDVFVCENPAVVAQAAVRLELSSRPIVCVEGVPNSAAHELLGLLRSGGCGLRYHGDFDWEGLRIGAGIIDRYGAAPWRFSSDDYRSAIDLGRVGLGVRPPRLGAPWSVDLIEAMEVADVAIFEEQVLERLLDDLAR